VAVLLLVLKLLARKLIGYWKLFGIYDDSVEASAWALGWVLFLVDILVLVVVYRWTESVVVRRFC